MVDDQIGTNGGTTRSRKVDPHLDDAPPRHLGIAPQAGRRRQQHGSRCRDDGAESHRLSWQHGAQCGARHPSAAQLVALRVAPELWVPSRAARDEDVAEPKDPDCAVEWVIP